MTDSATNSYSQILKASSIIGGAQGIKLLFGMVQIKFAAILIGPVGVGLIANYQAIQGMVGNLAGLGLPSSGVREVAEAVGRGDAAAIGRMVVTLRRVCWLTGLIGALAMAVVSKPLSVWTFGNPDHTLEIRLLALVILFGNIAGGQTALIQGMRRIGDLARLSLIASAAGTLITLVCYWFFGLRGIVPALLLMSAVQLAASWYFARQVPVPAVRMTWLESLGAAGGMVRLGLVFMWNGLIVSLVAYLTRALITQQISLEAVGIFSAAFALSGMLVNFVLSAMGADYYPRLTAVAADHRAVNRLVNEQTEIGLLLAVPGLLATLSLAPWIIQLFYSDAFLPAVELLQWFVLGCLGRVVSWPLGFVMLALGKGRWYFFTETGGNGFHLILIFVGVITLGIEGAAIAFFLLYLFYTVAVLAVAHHLTGFAWSIENRRLMAWLLPIVAGTFVAERLLPLWSATLTGLLITLIASVLCLRGLVNRIGPDHRIVQQLSKLPGVGTVFGNSQALT